MYKIEYFQDCNSEPVTVYDSRMKTYGVVFGGDLKLKYDETQIVTIIMYPNHSLFDTFNNGRQEIIICEGNNDSELDLRTKIVFRGRLLSIEENYSDKNSRFKQLTFEGIESMLMDNVVDQLFRPASSKLTDILKAMDYDIHIYAPWRDRYWDAYNVSFVTNLHSEFIYGPHPSEWLINPEGSSDKGGRFGESFDKVLKDIFKDVNAFLKKEHSFDYINGNPKLSTKLIPELKFPMGGHGATRLILGKHIQSFSQKYGFGDLKNLIFLDGKGAGSATSDLNSAIKHGPRTFYKSDQRFTVTESAKNWVENYILISKEIEVSAQINVVSKMPNEEQPIDLNVGGLLEIVNRDYERLAWGFIAEIDYNLNSPSKKKIYLGKPSPNLWRRKEGKN